MEASYFQTIMFDWSWFFLWRRANWPAQAARAEPDCPDQQLGDGAER